MQRPDAESDTDRMLSPLGKSATASSAVRPVRRIILWGVPMCLSTVFTRCMNARGDTEIFMEPYDNCHSFGPDRRIDWPAKEAELVNDWQTYSYTKSLLEGDFPESQIVFVKDMAFAVDGKYDVLPAGYRHTFLIRDPVKVWTAYHKRITQLFGGSGSDGSGGNDSKLAEDLESYASPTSVFRASYELMEYTRTALHQRPIVVDAGDLAARPESVLRRYCSEVGVPYRDIMLSFGRKDVEEEEDKKWHCSKFFSWGGKNGGFYAKAMQSAGFVRDMNAYNVVDLPPSVVECVKRSQPWYEKMYAIRMKPE